MYGKLRGRSGVAIFVFEQNNLLCVRLAARGRLMAEISVVAEAAAGKQLQSGEISVATRTTKPGTKRLFLTLLVLLLFILGYTFLHKSTEIYRSPLPFDAIESLSRLESVSFSYKFQAIFIGSHGEVTESHAQAVELSIYEQMHRESGSIGDVTVSAIINSGENCVRSRRFENSLFVRCGAIHHLILEQVGNSQAFDKILHEALRCPDGCDNVYTAVVVYGAEHVRTVVGQYRHFWITGNITETDAISLIAKVFLEVFLKGGVSKEKEEFMPVGADGNLVLSFSLLNSNPSDWSYYWEFKGIEEILLVPVARALSPIAKISVESQILYHSPKSSFSYWSEELGSHIVTVKDLPFFVNSNEWHLDPFDVVEGRSKVLHFVVYVPSARECPLHLQLPNGKFSTTNGFISPMWGGVIIWNPPGCLRRYQSAYSIWHTFSPQELQGILQISVAQLRLLFGLNSSDLHAKNVEISDYLQSETGFTQWELDSLFRHHTSFNLFSCGSTLRSLSRLVQSLPRMIIMEEIGKQVRHSVAAATAAENSATLGLYNKSAAASVRARALAEDAFFHPSIMSLSYSSIEHYFAIYLPYFAPVTLHVLLAVIKELRRFKQERAKYMAWYYSHALKQSRMVR